MNSLYPISARTLSLALLSVSIAVTPAASAPVNIGIAASVVGDVRLSNALITKPVKIARLQRLAWGDTVRTREESKVQILLLDRSTLTIAANARLTINRFVYDPGQSRSTSVTVSTGAFRFMSGRRTRNSTATVDAPTGSIGIRGTALDGIIGSDAVKIAKDEPFLKGVDSDRKTATLIVLRGPGVGTAGGLEVGLADVTAAGSTISLTAPALAAYIPRPGASPIGPFRLSRSGLGKLQDEFSQPGADAGNGGLLSKLLPAAVVGIALGTILTGEHKDVPCTPQRGAKVC